MIVLSIAVWLGIFQFLVSERNVSS